MVQNVRVNRKPYMTTETRQNYLENRQTFVDRCEVFFPHRLVLMIEFAYDFAKGAHAHQERKDEKNPDGTPVRYFEHVRRVPLILMDEAGLVTRPLVVIKGLLHDVYEDTRQSGEKIALVFGEEVSRDVLMMSKRPKAGFKERLLRHGSWEALAIKVADRVDNLRHMLNSDPAFVLKQYNESREMYPKVLARMRAIATTKEEVEVTNALENLFSDALAGVVHLLP